MVSGRLNGAARGVNGVACAAIGWWRRLTGMGGAKDQKRVGPGGRIRTWPGGDADRILSSFEILACDQLTGMSSPALLHVTPLPPPDAAVARDTAASIPGLLDEIRHASKVNSYYADAVLVAVVVIAAAILVKLAMPVPRSNGRSSTAETFNPRPALSAVRDDGARLESRLDFAARINAVYPRGTFAPDDDEIAFVPKGVPGRYLSDIATGALAVAAKPADPLAATQAPASEPPPAQSVASPRSEVKVQPVRRGAVRPTVMRRHGAVRRQHLPRPMPKQVIVIRTMPVAPMPPLVPLPPVAPPEPGSPASLFTPASEMPPYEVPDPAASKGSLMRGVYPIGPMEAEAARR